MIRRVSNILNLSIKNKIVLHENLDFDLHYRTTVKNIKNRTRTFSSKYRKHSFDTFLNIIQPVIPLCIPEIIK